MCLRFMLATVLVAACSADDGSSGGTADSSPPEAAGTAAATSANAVPEGIESDATPDVPATDAAVRDPQADATPEGPGTEGSDPDRVFVFPRPDQVRGLYVNAWSAGSRRRITALTELARRTEVNTSSSTSRTRPDTSVIPPRSRSRSGSGLPERSGYRTCGCCSRGSKKRGSTPSPRIVIVKDPLIAAAHPELAVQDTAGGPWMDDKGIVWLNPYNREVWDYHVAIAREVAGMGFPEIQWDYVRFPDAPASAMRRAYFPGGAGVPRPQAIREFLAYSRAELADMDVQVTADVFGVTTSFNRDVGIGQVWESFIDVVDVALPMVYPSHYWKGSFGYDRPNSHPYEIVRGALEDAVRRSAVIEGAGATRPGSRTSRWARRATKRRSARPDPGLLRCRHRGVDPLESGQPLHGSRARARGRVCGGAADEDRGPGGSRVQALRVLRHGHGHCATGEHGLGRGQGRQAVRFLKPAPGRSAYRRTISPAASNSEIPATLFPACHSSRSSRRSDCLSCLNDLTA